MQDIQSLVIDNGSGVIKAGHPGDAQPAVKFPSVIGYPKNDAVMTGVEAKPEYIGEEAQKLRGVLNLKYPITSGIVTDWDQMDKIWEYTFNNELRIDPSEYNVLLTEAPGNPKSNREKMADLMFETFNVNGFYVSIQAVLSLYANGRTTGLVCDSGDGVTHTVPVFEGHSIPHGVMKNFIAGRAITDYMTNILTLDGIQPQGASSSWSQIVRTMKEQVCYVALDYEAEKVKAGKVNECQKAYELPDGTVVNVNAPRFQAPEAIFNPDLIQSNEVKGIHNLTYESINECDVDTRTDLYKNIILSGGSTLYEGLPERLEKELNAICPQQGIVNIIAPPNRYYSVWCGGSTLCQLGTFASKWITRDEYDEHGAEIVHRKCQ